MAKKFLATYEEYVGAGDTLLEAWEELKNTYSDANDVGDVTFFEAEQIQVELKVVKKEVVTKISKKPQCGA